MLYEKRLNRRSLHFDVRIRDAAMAAASHSYGRLDNRNARRPPSLLDPHLVEQDAVLQVVLEVADAFGNEVGLPVVVEEQPRRLPRQPAIDIRPQGRRG